MVSLAQRYINQARAQSLEVRVVNEDMLTQKAAEKRLFGWGGWGRWRVTDASGEDISATDGQWVITLGSTGVVGLASMLAWMSLPLALLLRRCPPRLWLDPAVAPLAVLAVIVQLFLLDNLLNAMLNPFWTVAAGAVCAVAGSPRPRTTRQLAEVEGESADSEPEMAGAQATP
jgi:O-antigen ligase